MVLELHIPRGQTLAALRPLLPVFFCYALSFVFIGIYWNNHHHMLHAARRVSGGVLWANLHLLFWLSLLPFVTGWMGENDFAAIPTALYGVDLLMAGFAYSILCRSLISLEGKESMLGRALGRDRKGKISLVAYTLAIPLSFFNRWIAQGIYVLVELMWLIPDRRIERMIADSPE
jgi:uncharacterized membrane protein